MTVRLELKPDIEANLTAQARAKGVPLDAYLQSVVEDLARAKPIRRQAPRTSKQHSIASLRWGETSLTCRRLLSAARASTRTTTDVTLTVLPDTNILLRFADPHDPEHALGREAVKDESPRCRSDVRVLSMSTSSGHAILVDKWSQDMSFRPSTR